MTTRRTYSPGAGQPDVCGQAIAAEALHAAQQGHSLVRACPYPFMSEAGQHFVAVYYLNHHRHPATPRTAQVLARSAHALEIAQP